MSVHNPTTRIAHKGRVLLRHVHAVAAICLLAIACHHPTSQEPRLEPGETRPLPPSSGTPVGYLVDAAGDLKLTGDQVRKLQEIDDALAARLETIDSQARAADRPPEREETGSPQGRHGGGRHGGMGMGGMGRGGGGMGGTSRGGSGGPSRRGHGGDGSNAARLGGASVARLADERAGEVKYALARAFEVLDPTQREDARKLLAAHDIDVEPASGATAPTEPAAGDGSAEPAEP